MIEQNETNTAVAFLDDDPDERSLIEHELQKPENADLRPYFLFATSTDLYAKMKENTSIQTIALDYLLDNDDKNGLEVLKELRRMEEERYADDEFDNDEELFLIVVTGQASEKMLLEFMNVRPNHFIIKEHGHTHLPKLMDAVRAGLKKTKKRIERRLKYDNAVKGLIAKANEIHKQVASYDSGTNRRTD